MFGNWTLDDTVMHIIDPRGRPSVSGSFGPLSPSTKKHSAKNPGIISKFDLSGQGFIKTVTSK
jgi:hypothetical protein